MSDVTGDRLTPVIVVRDLAAARPFYRDVLGFVEGVHEQRPEGAFAMYRYASSQVAVAEPGSLPDLPAGPTRGAVLVIEVRDLDAVARALDGRRAPHDAVRCGWWGRHLDVTDPGGNVVRFIELTEEARDNPGVR